MPGSAGCTASRTTRLFSGDSGFVSSRLRLSVRNFQRRRDGSPSKSEVEADFFLLFSIFIIQDLIPAIHGKDAVSDMHVLKPIKAHGTFPFETFVFLIWGKYEIVLPFVS